MIGGVVPDEDLDELAAAGVGAVLGPGASAVEVVASVRGVVARVSVQPATEGRTPAELLAAARDGERRAIARLLTRRGTRWWGR